MMYAVHCQYKRTKVSKTETGILVQGVQNVIIDLEGVPVESVWNYTELPGQGCFVIEDTRPFEKGTLNEVRSPTP